MLWLEWNDCTVVCVYFHLVDVFDTFLFILFQPIQRTHPLTSPATSQTHTHACTHACTHTHIYPHVYTGTHTQLNLHPSNQPRQTEPGIYLQFHFPLLCHLSTFLHISPGSLQTLFNPLKCCIFFILVFFLLPFVDLTLSSTQLISLPTSVCIEYLWRCWDDPGLCSRGTLHL